MSAHVRKTACYLARSILLMCVLFGVLWSPAKADSRSFKVALFGGNEPEYTDTGWFYPGGIQLARDSILVVSGIYDRTDLASYLANQNYSWSRIVAVLIDEPYLHAITDADGCSYDYSKVVKTKTDIQNAASVVRALAGTAPTRVWVNFSEPEVVLMENCIDLNDQLVDLVSLDKYATPFSAVEPYYAWLTANRAKPGQRLALVPGVFYFGPEFASHPNYVDAATALSYLQGYFDYADRINATSPDDPLVWLIAGFHASIFTEGGLVYQGLTAPGSASIAARWATERRRSFQPSHWMPPIVSSLF